MEIFLQCKSAYNIPNWTGAIEVRPLMLYQMKRMAGSRNNTTLFRKIIKIFKSEQSPISLPEGLNTDNLDIGDFMQILVALAAVSRARQIKKTYECPYCKKDQPRVVDIISVFKPQVPEIEGGIKEIALSADSKAVCQHIRVQDYMAIKEAVESIQAGSYDAKGVITLEKVRAKYGKIYEFNDEEDLNDFCDLLDDMGAIALRTEIGAKSFEEKLQWMFQLNGEQQELYREMYLTTMQLSSDMENEYKSVCTACGKEFTAELEPTDYFFDSQWISSKA